MNVNMSRCCANCPFRAKSAGFFPPEALDQSVGNNLRTGYAHNCHPTNDLEHPKVCAGFLQFVRREKVQNYVVMVGEAMEVFGPVHGDVPLIVGGWEEVLAEHRRRQEAADAKR